MLRLTALFAALLAAVACNPYDPDLGQVPFKCGQDEPRCPEGYGPVMLDAVTCVCQEGAEGPDIDAGAGDGGLQCNNDSAITGDPLGNESKDTPTSTAIATGGASTWTQTGLAICPATDVDVFTLGPVIGGKTIEANIYFNLSEGDLLLQILDPAGSAVASGTPDTGGASASYTVTATGTHYLRIATASESANNYSAYVEVN